jgi:hypothetical protein
VLAAVRRRLLEAAIPRASQCRRAVLAPSGADSIAQIEGVLGVRPTTQRTSWPASTLGMRIPRASDPTAARSAAAKVVRGALIRTHARCTVNAWETNSRAVSLATGGTAS